MSKEKKDPVMVLVLAALAGAILYWCWFVP